MYRFGVFVRGFLWRLCRTEAEWYALIAEAKHLFGDEDVTTFDMAFARWPQ